MCPRKSPQTQAHHLFNLSGSLLLRHWEAHWYNSPFVALSVSWWRGAPRSEDTHFIRQWREQQKPSLPFVCDAHAEALAAIKAPDSLWMGPDRYWSHRQICREPSFLLPPRQPLISAVSIGTLDIHSPLHLVGQRLWKKKRPHQFRPTTLFVFIDLFSNFGRGWLQTDFFKCGSRQNLLKLPGFSFLLSSSNLWPQWPWSLTDPPKERPKPGGTTSIMRSGTCALSCPSPRRTRSASPTCTPWPPSAPTSGSLLSSRVSLHSSVFEKMSLNILSIFSSHQCQTKWD